MTAPRNPDRLIRAFLDEGLTELPDQVYDAVRAEIEQTRQRPFIGPWRAPEMNRLVGFGLAAAAVVVVAFIGIQVLGGGNVGGLPVETPAPAESQSPTPLSSPAAVPTNLFPAAAETVSGRLPLTRGGLSFSVDLGTTTWISDGVAWINTGVTPDAAGLLFWAPDPDNVYADPCTQTPLDPPAGPSAADLAAAMASVPGTDLVSGPRAVNLGGRPGQHVVITVRDDIECSPNDFYLWYFADAEGVICGAGEAECYRYATELGSTIYVWIVEVDGTRLVIEGETYAGAGPEVAQELQQIVASLQFE